MPDILEKSGPEAVFNRPLYRGAFKAIRILDGLCDERLVIRALSGMDQGFMKITLPTGRVMTLGKPGADIKAKIRITSPEFFRKCVLYGDIGFGEAYVDGDWQTDHLTDVIRWMILNVNSNPAMSGSKRSFKAVNVLQSINKLIHQFKPNDKSGSEKNIREHYDLSNEFFKTFLDPSMTYSAGIFETVDQSLEQAQWLKYDRLCRKLKLQPTDRVLEIGCGWGGFAVHAARHYGCHITGITISREQLAYAKERVAREGLQSKIDLRFEDYRNLKGSYDKIVSIEMLEAVGHEFLEGYFAKCHELLKPQGILGLQVITCPDDRYDALRGSVDWIQKHIFPGSLLPSVAAVNKAVNCTGNMVLHHLEDLALNYARTLNTWRKNLNARREQPRSSPLALMGLSNVNGITTSVTAKRRLTCLILLCCRWSTRGPTTARFETKAHCLPKAGSLAGKAGALRVSGMRDRRLPGARVDHAPLLFSRLDI